jgi:hypothetical protein
MKAASSSRGGCQNATEGPDAPCGAPDRLACWTYVFFCLLLLRAGGPRRLRRRHAPTRRCLASGREMFANRSDGGACWRGLLLGARWPGGDRLTRRRAAGGLAGHSSAVCEVKHVRPRTRAVPQSRPVLATISALGPAPLTPAVDPSAARSTAWCGRSGSWGGQQRQAQAPPDGHWRLELTCRDLSKKK